MKSFLSQGLRIHPGEMGLLLTLSFLLFSNSVATQVSGVVAVSGFLSEGGVNQMPIVWIVDMLVIILTTSLQSLIVDRFERRKLMRWMMLGFALVFIAMRVMFWLQAPGWLNYGLMFILSEQQLLFLPLTFWILAQDAVSVAQAKRLFPLIASLSLVGELVGLGVAAAAPGMLQSVGNSGAEELLIFNALMYLLACGVAVFGLGKIQVRQTAQLEGNIRQVLAEGLDFVRSVQTFRYLSVAILSTQLCLILLEFHFLVVTDQAFAANYQTFYGLYRLGLTVASFVVQAFVTSRLIERLALKNSFLLMPVALLGGSLWMLLPGAVNAIGGVLVPKITQYTVDESTLKSFQALVPEERRGRVSMFIESYLLAFGILAGAALILVVLFAGAALGEEASSYILRALAVGAALVAASAILKMRSVYDLSLFDWRLKRRQRSISGLEKLGYE
jgi:AAA family ATP:ADP antiporter